MDTLPSGLASTVRDSCMHPRLAFAYGSFVCSWAHLVRDEEYADTISFLKKPRKKTALFMCMYTSAKDQFLVRDSYTYSSQELLRSRRGYEGSVCLNGLWRVHIFELRKRPVFLRSSLRTRTHRHILSNNSFVVWFVTTNTISAFVRLTCHRITNESFVVSFSTTNAMDRTFFVSHLPFTQKASFLEKKSKHLLRYPKTGLFERVSWFFWERESGVL